ncbi:septum formation inhibitor Maf [Sporanaerobium hydrogeniformans]|uniref:Septum formation inhibitor Maf n=1 Tax=Sporanaerobium hydrogeniformans TaxID=3072179 RepID=A0AC61DF03_9FIRM|nr:Maf family protein [Sporanaerobium hydrogeniformans]PHV71480.1 septum formation inhibitor Maf [Sporanaerobium hydrogeniformans]
MIEWILASSSPRRQELLERLPFSFSVEVAQVEETICSSLSPRQNVENLAKQKAEAVARKHPNKWIIGCDTLVALEQHILGKPQDANEARKMLYQLSGKVHSVYTGICIIRAQDSFLKVFSEKTKVHMKQLSEEEVTAYVITGEPLDKAGAYGIQGQGGLYIEGIEGDYYNVMGLPLCRLYKEIMEFYKFY